MKKYYKSEQENKSGRWSDGFSNTKNGKPSKTNKPKKADSIEFEDGTTFLVDESADVTAITGNVLMFAVEGKSLIVGGKKIT